MNEKQYWSMLVLAILGGFLSGATASWLFVDQPVFAEKKSQHKEVIRAEKFELINKDGKAVGMLGFWRETWPSLVFFRKEAKSPKASILLYVDKWGWPSLTLYSAPSVSRDYSFMASINPVKLSLTAQRNEKFMGSIALGTGKDGSFLELLDENFFDRARLLLEPDGNVDLSLCDSSLQARAVLGNVSLENKKTGIVEQRPVSSLVLFDKDGKVIWSVP